MAGRFEGMSSALAYVTFDPSVARFDKVPLGSTLTNGPSPHKISPVELRQDGAGRLSASGENLPGHVRPMQTVCEQGWLAVRMEHGGYSDGADRRDKAVIHLGLTEDGSLVMRKASVAKATALWAFTSTGHLVYWARFRPQ